MHIFNRFCLSLALFLVCWALIPLFYKYAAGQILKKKKDDDEEDVEESPTSDLPPLQPLLRKWKQAEAVLFERA